MRDPYMSLMGTTGEIDFSAFERGEPLKIDCKDWYIPHLQNKIRAFLKKNGHPRVSLKTIYDDRPPFKTWIYCDWQKGRKSKIDHRNDSKYGEFFTKGFVKVWATHEDADNPNKLRSAVRNALARYAVGGYDMRVTPISRIHFGDVIEGWLFENLNFKKEE